MAVSGLKKSTALAALAFALAGLGVPSLAQAEEQDGGRRGGWAERHGGGEAQGQVGEQRSWQRQQSQAPAPQPAPQQRAWNGGQGGGGGWQGRQAAPPPQVQSQAPAPRAWGGGQGDGQRGGWQGRRQNAENVAQQTPETPRSGMFGRRDRSGGDGDGERRNRNWGGGGQGGQQGWSRPASTPVPQAESRTVTNEQPRENWRSRNGGYTDPNRNGSYRDNRRDDNNRNWRDGERRRDGSGGYADGRRWDGDNRRGDNDRWRDGRRWDRDERGWNNFGRDRNDNDHRRHGPGSWGYNPNRSGTWWNSYGYNGSWRNNRHSYYNNGSWRRWNRDWRHDRRYDWYGWRNSHSDWFRLDYYYAPYRNYSYRRLSIGFFLDALFYSERYWIDDPWQYRLPEVYGPYRWVRYYDDALLVDIYTGEVVDVIHDFFW